MFFSALDMTIAIQYSGTCVFQELEQKLGEQEDSAAIARAVQNDVKRLAELEKQNKKLSDENRYFR